MSEKERNIPHIIKRGKANWTVHILHTNCFLKHIIEGKIEGKTEDKKEDISSYWMTLTK
jgi:hypothetical protein